MEAIKMLHFADSRVTRKINKNILSGLCGNYKHRQSRVLIAISPPPAN